jgi:hypothetical protein
MNQIGVSHLIFNVISNAPSEHLTCLSTQAKSISMQNEINISLSLKCCYS